MLLGSEGGGSEKPQSQMAVSSAASNRLEGMVQFDKG